MEVTTPGLSVVDGSGAGAVFSAGLIFAHIQGWALEKCPRFATAAGSPKCSMFFGLKDLDAGQIGELAERLTSS